MLILQMDHVFQNVFLALALKLHRRLLQEGRPRKLKPASAITWFIQTDACYDLEGDQTMA